MAEENEEQRKHARLKLELPVEVQIDGDGYRKVMIVDISPTGIQLWCDDVSKFGEHHGAEFELKFRAKMAWSQPMEDRSYLTGWEIELGSK